MSAEKPAVASFVATLPDDLVWLARHQGSPYTATTCRTMLRALRPDATRHQRDVAETRHDIGTRITDLVTHGAVTTLGRASLAEFLETDCGIDPPDGYEWIRFARDTTAEEAVTYGFSRCRVGARLVRQLELRTLKELAAKPIEVPTEEGATETVAFTPTVAVAKLRRALERLREAAAAPAEPETSPRILARRLREYESVVDEFVEKYEVLESAKVRVTLYAGQVRVQHRPLATSDEFAAIGRLYSELSRVR